MPGRIELRITPSIWPFWRRLRARRRVQRFPAAQQRPAPGPGPGSAPADDPASWACRCGDGRPPSALARRVSSSFPRVTERTLGDSAGSLADRFWPVKGLLPRRLEPSTRSAPVSSTLSLTPSRVHPPLCLQTTAGRPDPEPLVEVSDDTRDVFPRLHYSRRGRRVQQHLRIAVSAAASMRAIRRSCSVRWCPAGSAEAFHPRRCPSRSSGAASAPGRVRARRSRPAVGSNEPNNEPTLHLGLGFLRHLGEITDLGLALHLLRERLELPQRVRLGSRDRPDVSAPSTRDLVDPAACSRMFMASSMSRPAPIMSATQRRPGRGARHRVSRRSWRDSR